MDTIHFSLTQAEAATAAPRTSTNQRRDASVTARDEASRTRRYGDLLLVAPCLVLFYVQLAHHQPWLDEMNVWGIALASPTLKHLFYLIHYEAHPTIWYLLLWVASRFTANPAAMKVVEAVIGTGSYLVLALKSPFSRTEKVLLFLSYFFAFEYTVMMRMYGVLLLLALVYAYLRNTRPDRILLIALVFALMVNTDTMGILLSSALAVEYLYYQWKQDPGLRLQRRKPSVAALLYLGATALAIYTLRPAKDISTVNAGRIFSKAGNPLHLFHAVINVVLLPWLPISLNFPHRFWEPVAAPDVALYPIVLPLVAILLYATFRNDRSGQLIFWLTVAALILFEDAIYLGSIRHDGMAFLAFVVALWTQRRVRPRIPAPAWGLLALSALGGVTADVGQWIHPFSNARAFASYIRRHHLDGEPLIGTDRVSASALALTSGRRLYFLDCQCVSTFAKYDDGGDDYDWSKAPLRLERAMDKYPDQKALLASDRYLSDDQLQNLNSDGLLLLELQRWPNSDVPADTVVLYQVTRVVNGDARRRTPLFSTKHER
jgi:hypothetical protein